MTTPTLSAADRTAEHLVAAALAGHPITPAPPQVTHNWAEKWSTLLTDGRLWTPRPTPIDTMTLIAASQRLQGHHPPPVMTVAEYAMSPQAAAIDGPAGRGAAWWGLAWVALSNLVDVYRLAYIKRNFKEFVGPKRLHALSCVVTAACCAFMLLISGNGVHASIYFIFVCLWILRSARYDS
jgi:hypothetical protein